MAGSDIRTRDLKVIYEPDTLTTRPLAPTCTTVQCVYFVSRVHCRRLRYIGHNTRGVYPGEVAVCAGRVRPDAVSGATDALR